MKAHFSIGPICLKLERGPWSRTQRPMCDGFDFSCSFHGSRLRVPNYIVRQTSRAICTATFTEAGDTTGKHFCGHIWHLRMH